MKVAADSWRSSAGSSAYKASALSGTSTQSKTSAQKETASADRDKESISSLAVSGKDSKGSDNFKMKASSSDHSVGQLASELAQAETRMDVLQVYSKAMRALTNLKMASLAGGDGKEAKKAAQQVKRMEKLIKRIQKKLKQLSKEEQLERQRQQALKRQQMQKEKEIREELAARRKKRRKDEKNYADKEMAQDSKDASNELMSSLAGAGACSPDLASSGSIGEMLSGGDLSGALGAGAVGIDISV